MPIDYTSRTIATGASSPYVPLITNNPAFQVQIVPLDGRMEQKPNSTDDTAQQMAVKIGDTIRGEVVSRTRKKGENVLARVLQILLDDGSVVGFKGVTQRGKEVIIDPTTASKVQTNGDALPMNVSTKNPVTENHVMLYEEWKFSQSK